MRLTMREDSMASYDDLGKVKKSAYVLEAGIYRFWLGGSVREAKEIPFFVEKDEAEIVGPVFGKMRAQGAEAETAF